MKHTHEIVNRGFVAPTEICPEEYVLGAGNIPEHELQPNGQWDDFLPIGSETQNRYVETYNCTSYGTLNVVEIIFRKKFKKEKDLSDRYLGSVAGTRPPGNSPHVVAEAMRKSGIVSESSLPYSPEIDTIDEYFSLGSRAKQLKSEGKKWLEIYDFRHEWVFTPGISLAEKKIRLMTALRYSPVGVSVLAWKERDGLYFKEAGEPDSHWTVLYGYVDGKYWKIYDSYDNTLKKLEWDYDFGFAKRYFVDAKVEDPEYYESNNLSPKKNWLSSFLEFFINLFS